LFRDLLVKFRDDQCRVTEDIRAALENRDAELAARLAHNLTGVSGNLGINDLAKASKELETGLKTDGLEFPPVLLQSMQQQLDLVLSSLSLIEDVERSWATGPVAQEQVIENLDQLRGMIENYDIAASAVVKQLSGQLRDEAFAVPLSALEQAVDCFDFELAQERLSALDVLVRHQA
jgi:two-component system sensor histidine kinase/response regulator